MKILSTIEINDNHILLVSYKQAVLIYNSLKNFGYRLTNTDNEEAFLLDLKSNYSPDESLNSYQDFLFYCINEEEKTFTCISRRLQSLK
jgi:hypothetical protein